ncbi:hypothetical protein [Pseudescherichia sp.]|uniref:hypothetical protein n=1 Tax=Pseudescherichia sp. TaxID=2055881 RepID=UPI00289D0A1C|nr:hypothetical protein [Pseudescherichia sp.]
MSWDNVSSVNTIRIWTDYSDSTQGHLFVNDNHRLKLNVGIDFTLKAGTTEGPTEDEIRSTITFINNMDGGPLKYLTLADENTYTAVYDPYHTQAVDTDNAKDGDDGVYDNVITYYLSSPSSVNAETYSESVALMMEYHGTHTDGTAIDIDVDTSSVVNSGGFATYVSVVCYPAKLYGNKGENRTCITYNSKAVDEADCWDVDDGHYKHDNDQFRVIWFYIDDSYFKLFHFDGSTEPDSSVVHNPYYRYREYIQGNPQYDHLYNAFFPSVKCGEIDFDTKIAVRPDDDGMIAVTENITVHQQQNQITFLGARTTVKSCDIIYKSTNVYLQVYDQFGNSAYVVAYSNADDALVKSVS